MGFVVQPVRDLLKEVTNVVLQTPLTSTRSVVLMGNPSLREVGPAALTTEFMVALGVSVVLLVMSSKVVFVVLPNTSTVVEFVVLLER